METKWRSAKGKSGADGDRKEESSCQMASIFAMEILARSWAKSRGRGHESCDTSQLQWKIAFA